MVSDAKQERKTHVMVDGKLTVKTVAEVAEAVDDAVKAKRVEEFFRKLKARMGKKHV